MDRSKVDQLLEGLTGDGKACVSEMVAYMRRNYPNLEEVVSFQMPTYKLGTGKDRNYIAFSPAAKHFSLHTMDFDYIETLKTRLQKPGKGKGCVNVAFGDEEGKKVLLEAVSDIVKRSEQ